MSKHYVYSTASNDQQFRIYLDQKPGAQGGRPGVVQQRILIAGKANVINSKNFITPRGVVTEVTEDELNALRKVKAFVQMEKDGFMTVSKAKADPEKVAADSLEPKDASAQKTAGDFEAMRDAAQPSGKSLDKSDPAVKKGGNKGGKGKNQTAAL